MKEGKNGWNRERKKRKKCSIVTLIPKKKWPSFFKDTLFSKPNTPGQMTELF